MLLLPVVYDKRFMVMVNDGFVIVLSVGVCFLMYICVDFNDHECKLLNKYTASIYQKKKKESGEHFSRF